MNSSILNLSKASKGYMFQMQFVTFKSFLEIYQPTLFVPFSTKREFSFRKKNRYQKAKKMQLLNYCIFMTEICVCWIDDVIGRYFYTFNKCGVMFILLFDSWIFKGVFKISLKNKNCKNFQISIHRFDRFILLRFPDKNDRNILLRSLCFIIINLR